MNKDEIEHKQAELFRIRNEIDMLDAQIKQLAQLYNKKYEELKTIETKEQNKKNNDSKEQEGSN